MAATERPRWVWVAVPLILATGCLAYGNAFRVPFVLDDEWAIVNNLPIRNPAFLYSPALWGQEYTGRLVTLWTFALNYRFGGLNVTGYHAVNLAIHLFSAFLVFDLLRLTLGTPYFEVPGSTFHVPDPETPNSRPDTWHSELGTRYSTLDTRHFVPLFAALLFVSHPVQTQAVTYVVQRMTSLSTLLYLLSVVLYVRARLAGERLRGLAPGVLLPYLGAVLAAFLAMKTKETAFTLPLALVLYEACFLRGGWRRRVLWLAPLLALLPIVPLAVFSFPGASAGPPAQSLGEAGAQLGPQIGLSRQEYLFTQLRVIVTYLRLLVFPAGQNLDYDYPAQKAFLAGPVLLSFLLLVGLAGLALWLYVVSGGTVPRERGGRARASTVPPEARLISFGILWFFLTLSVESSFVPLPDVIFEHRLYLPGLGLFSAFAAVLALGLERARARPWQAAALAGLLVCALTAATLQRNRVWRDEVRLWEDVVSKSPRKVRPLNNLGVALNRSGRAAEAVEVLSRAVALDPLHPDAYNNLGRAYIVTGQSSAAVPVLRAVIRMYPGFAGAYVNLAAAHNQLRQFRDTVALLEPKLATLGDRVEVQYHLGVAYAFLGNREAAQRQLEIVSRANAPPLVEDLRRLLR